MRDIFFKIAKRARQWDWNVQKTDVIPHKIYMDLVISPEKNIIMAPNSYTN